MNSSDIKSQHHYKQSAALLAGFLAEKKRRGKLEAIMDNPSQSPEAGHQTVHQHSVPYL